MQKTRIITLLQELGHTVGFLGDGINDASALRQSMWDISVDTAVDIAKESADIILLEKDLMVLEDGVIEGRRTFGNIMKYIKMTASSNFGNMLACWLPVPFCLSCLCCLSICLFRICCTIRRSPPFRSDRMDPEYLMKPRKWDASDLSRFMIFYRSGQFYFRHSLISGHVVCVRLQLSRTSDSLSVRLVCRGLAVANVDCTYDPYPQDPVYSEYGILAGIMTNVRHHGSGNRHSLHAVWGLPSG